MQWYMSVTSALLRQKDLEFKSSLDYNQDPVSKNKKKYFKVLGLNFQFYLGL
jgi:hypothetical protein